MSDSIVTRRRLLAGLALGVGALASGRARALTEEGVNTAKQAVYDQACRARGEEHRRVLAEAEAMLADKPMTADEKKKFLAALNCPICGCPVTAGLF